MQAPTQVPTATQEPPEPPQAVALAMDNQRLKLALDQAKRELRRQLAKHEQMRAILLSALQSLTVGVMAVGQDGVVIVANPAACALLGRDLKAVAGRAVDAVLPELPEVAGLLLTLQGAGDAQRQALWSPPGPQGEPLQILLTAVRARSPYDRQIAGLVLLEDRTEMTRLEGLAQLHSRLSGMGEIAMSLAHEIRNPLGSIVLFSTTLEHELAKEPDLAQIAGQITHGVQSLERLVADTLAFARPRRLAFARVSLRHVVEEALTYVSHPVRQHGIRVLYDRKRTPEASIDGDAEQLKQVFLNLFLNAIQAMENGGALGVAIQAAERDRWRVVVTDEGDGIPDDAMEKIFDPFYTTREKGSGLGLAIVRRILTDHAANIRVQSRMGAGTRMTMTFPARMREQARA
jgi:nitrogen fixation/metabolism regulation signal transduction histidine kinase